jgi:hypothetical protein
VVSDLFFTPRACLNQLEPMSITFWLFSMNTVKLNTC